MVEDMFKIGFGYDVHSLVEGKSLILGGVKIPYIKGLLGYSDADVLTHAVIDAILGALGKGDIGRHFPGSDPAYKGVDSLFLLKEVMKLVQDEGLKVNNLDATMVAQKPRLVTYLNEIQPKMLHACHCTDLPSKIALSNTLNLKEVGVGLTLRFN